MNNQAYVAMQMRLDLVRETIEKLSMIGRENYPNYPDGALVHRLSEEQRGLEDALVGDDPVILASLDWLRGRYAKSDLVMQRSEGILMRLGGNESWVLADVAIGDDYGAVDFWQCYAIWRNTGDVYRVGSDGAVEDDPIKRGADA
jgi:hypothetical protein